LEAPEQIRAKREVTARREFVGDRAHDAIDAEDLLNDHEPRATARSRRGEIGAEFTVRAALDPDVQTSHAALPDILGNVSGGPGLPPTRYCAVCPGWRRVGSCSICESVTGLVIGAEQVPRWQT